MTVNYTTISEKDLGNGIDARSAENQLEPGFVEDALNGDTIENRVKKRKGYSLNAGFVPLRINSVTNDTTLGKLCFNLDNSIDTTSLESSPIIVHGTSSIGVDGVDDFSGVLTTQYYDRFSSEVRKPLAAADSAYTIPATEHTLATSKMFVNAVESTSDSDLSHTRFIPDGLNIDQASYLITVDYDRTEQPNTSSSLTYVADKGTDSSTVYSDTTSFATGTNAFSIDAATHNLTNFNILTQVYRDTGSAYERFIPEEVKILANGTVEVTVVNPDAAIDVLIILSAAPAANQITGTIPSLATNSLSILNVESPFIFYSVYLKDGVDLIEVIPDTVTYSAASNSLSFSFTNGENADAEFEIYYEYGTLQTSRLCVDANISEFDDSAPQLTLYGIDPSLVQSSSNLKGGWVNHLDAYRNPTTSQLIAGLGGNLFKDQDVVTSLLTTPAALLPNIFSRVSSDLILAPAFQPTGSTVNRTKGKIEFDGGDDHLGNITTVSYDSGTGFTKYTISTPNLVTSTTITDIVTAQDKLTVTNCGYSATNGTFDVETITETVEPDPLLKTIVIAVSNPNVTNSDHDEIDVGGFAGVFTDVINVQADSEFIVDDTVISGSFDDATLLTVLTTSGSDIYVTGVVDTVTLSNGETITSTRTSEVVPVTDTDNYVKGDMIFLTGKDDPLKIKYINPEISEAVTFTSGVVSGLTDTSIFNVGQSLPFVGAVTGTFVVTAVGDTTITLDTTVSGASTLIGKTIEVDTAITFSSTLDSSIGFVPTSRWESLESPTTSSDKVSDTTYRYLDTDAYSNSRPLRSTTVANNMYFTNGADSVYKYDGVSLYRAGLLKHQAGLFVSVDTGASAKIQIPDNISVAVSSLTGGDYAAVVPLGEQTGLSVGDNVTTDNGISTIIRSVGASTTQGIVFVKDKITGATTLSRPAIYKYYFRLNAVDANSNIIASAVVGSEDFIVELNEDAAVTIRLLSPPTFDNLDYDNINVEVYRTLAGGVTFYKLSSESLSFNTSSGYITIVDTTTDDVIDSLANLDSVNSVLKQVELGLEFEAPLRSKYITSANNRLILANLKDYPKADLQLFPESKITESELDGSDWFFYKDDADTLTSSDVLNRIGYTLTTTKASKSIAKGTDTFTVAGSPGDYAANRWIYVQDSDHLISGWWQVTSLSGDDAVIAAPGVTPGTASYDVSFLATDKVPIYIGNDDVNYGASRGNLSIGGIIGGIFSKRLSDAINASMVQTIVSDFTPWLRASGEGTLENGRIIISSPLDSSSFPAVDMPSLAEVKIFVNGNLDSGKVTFPVRLYPSRAIISYSNFPEIFDQPTAVDENESDSVVDINSADGQEITGIIPFFGESTNQDSSKQDTLIVFKTNSIYTLNATTRAISKIDSRGLGCTAPYSIAQVPNGIIFANDSGVYRLNRGFDVIYIGRKIERLWADIDKDRIAELHGHTYPLEQVYKLSVPLKATTTSGTKPNEQVYVYDYAAEDSGRTGGWVRYDNHASTGWANLASVAFFGASTGKVFKIRGAGDSTDFKDDETAVNFELTTRALDFGNPALRKVVRRIITHFRTIETSTNTKMFFNFDLNGEFLESTNFNLDVDTELDNLSDTINKKIISIRHALSTQRGIYLQLKYTNDGTEDIDIAGISFKIGGLTTKGIVEAADTTS